MPFGVHTIGEDAFSNCWLLENIEIPDSVTTIDYYAFSGCEALSDITIPASVTQIRGSAFSGCRNLFEIKVDAGNKNFTAVDNVLFSKDMKRIVTCAKNKEGIYQISNGVTVIDENAFEGCADITTISLPNTVTDIKWDAFMDCRNLSSINIPASVRNIDSNVFDGCVDLNEIKVDSKNTVYALFDKVLMTKDRTRILTCEKDKAGEYSIPNSVINIDNSAFADCKALTKVIIPSSVTVLKGSTFSDCTSLKEIVIPDTVKSIEWGVFCRCINLEKIELPQCVTEIEDDLFSGCQSLRSIVIPDSVKIIGNYAFENCADLSEVIIPDSVESIGEYAFNNCPMLLSVILPNANTEIGKMAFGYYDYASEKVEGFVMFGDPGSEAEKYAIENGLMFNERPLIISVTVNGKLHRLVNTNDVPEECTMYVCALYDAGKMIAVSSAEKSNINQMNSFNFNTGKLSDAYSIKIMLLNGWIPTAENMSYESVF